MSGMALRQALLSAGLRTGIPFHPPLPPGGYRPGQLCTSPSWKVVLSGYQESQHQGAAGGEVEEEFVGGAGGAGLRAPAMACGFWTVCAAAAWAGAAARAVAMFCC